MSLFEASQTTTSGQVNVVSMDVPCRLTTMFDPLQDIIIMYDFADAFKTGKRFFVADLRKHCEFGEYGIGRWVDRYSQVAVRFNPKEPAKSANAFARIACGKYQ